MSERRSLSSAMEITPEKLAFIQGTPVSTTATISEPERPKTTSQALTGTGRQPRGSREKPHGPPEEKDDSILTEGLLVPLTTRLKPKTADGLRRAYLEQKLKRRHPATQQEIVELALVNWLTKEGYLQENK